MLRRTFARAFPLALAALLLAPSAQAQSALPPGQIADAVARLKPGEFLWAPEVSPAGPLLLIVNRETQRAVLYRNGVPMAVTTVSTGRPGYRTPTGVFTVLQKQQVHYSSLYANAPMPYMQRLTWQGVALHGGELPGYPASHGCIRLPQGFAQLLYGVTTLGMSVIVTDAPGLPRVAPVDDPFGMDGAALVSSAGLDWHPERAPEGPVSIVVSAADRRVVVLRNGRRIGSAAVRLEVPVAGTTALVLRVAGDGTRQWLAVSASDAATPVPPDYWRGFHADPGFVGAVAAVIQPGTTIVVTADALSGVRSGEAGTLLEGGTEPH